MNIKTKYNLQQEVGVVYNGLPCNGLITGISIRTDLKNFLITYDVYVTNFLGEELGDRTYDENHVYKSRLCKEIQIEIAMLENQ